MAATPEDYQTREHYVYMAKLAEQAERYDDMVTYMDNLVLTTTSSGGELTAEERNLLSSAYKNVTGPLRAASRIVSSVEQQEEARSSKNNTSVTLVRDYRSEVESELSDVCARVLYLLDNTLLPSAVSNESKVFYLKMKGDYHRYLAEFKTGDERESAVDDTMNAYKAAEETAAELPPNHPIRLGLALNFTVFYYEILNDADQACNMAKLAFEEAVAEGEGSYKDDSNVILDLLKDNFTLWKSEQHVNTDYD